MKTLKKISTIITLASLVVFSVVPSTAVQALTPAEIQEQISRLLAQVVELQRQLAQEQGALPACLDVDFGRNLSQGMSGADVKCLQQILNSDPATQVASSGLGSKGNETIFFGPLTRSAVIKFQEKYASQILAPLGLISGTGFVGQMTKDKLLDFISPGGVGGPEPGVETENSVELAADTPAASSVAKGARDVSFLKLIFSAGQDLYTVSQIVLTRQGVSLDSDISTVRLFDGQNQIGSTQAVNTATHKVVFTNLNFQVPAGSSRTLTVKADISATAVTGDTIRFSLADSSDLVSAVALTAAFPIIGEAMTVAGLSTGALTIEIVPGAGGARMAGGTNQDVAGFRFSASAAEGISLQGITLTEVGSSVDADISNIKIWEGGRQIGSTIPFLTSGRAIFDLSTNPVAISAGATKTITVTADINTGLGINSRTIAFEITTDRDVIAYGSNSQGRVPVLGSPQRSASNVVVFGSLTLSLASAFSPSAKDVVRGSSQVDLLALKFTAGPTEDVRIAQIKLQRASASLADSDISNIALYNAETSIRIGETVPLISGVATFGFNSSGLDLYGLLDIPAGSSRTVLVKADVPTAASVGSSRLGLKINNPTLDIKADGLTSRNDLSSTEINGGSVSSAPSAGSEILHNITAQGSLSLQVAPNTPSSATFTVGTTEFEFAKFNFTATGEPITLSQLSVLFAKDSSAALTTSPAASGDVSNVKLYEGGNLLALGTAISGGKSSFSLNLAIPANSFRTFSIKADVPISSTANFLHAHIASASDVSASGQFSGQTITAASADFAALRGNLMTRGAPALTVRASPVPASQTIVRGANDAGLASLFLTGSTAEDIRVNRIKIMISASIDSTVSNFDNIFVSQTLTEPIGALVGNVKLFVEGVQLGNTVPTLTVGTASGLAEFSGLNLIIPKGATKIVEIKASILGSSSLNIFTGMSSDAGNVSASGLQSGQSVSLTIGSGQGTGGNRMVLANSGTMAGSSDSGMPASAQSLANGSDAVFGKWKLTASGEAMLVSQLIFNIEHSSASLGQSLGHSGPITSLLAVHTPASFNYSIDGGTAVACTISSASDLAAGAAIANEISADCPDLTASFNSAANRYEIAPDVAGGGTSLQITNYSVSGQNIADDFKLGLKYGGTETIGTNEGSDSNIRRVKIYDGNAFLAEALPGAEIAGKIIFNFPAGGEVAIPAPFGKVLTLKADLSDSADAVEGSTLAFALDSVSARGFNSNTVVNSQNLSLSSNPMFIYANKPVVSAPDNIQPQPSQGTNQEVFRFLVATADTGHDVSINAIRFTVGSQSGAGSAVFGRTFRLYKSTDLSTVLAEAQSNANNISTDSTGWVAMYPATPIILAGNSSATFVLKADTSAINTSSSTNEPLVLSIETGDFYWDDSLVPNARDRVMNLPVTGRLLQF